MSDSFITLWTVAYQAPLSMIFSRQKYWSGLLFHSPGISLIQESNPHLLHYRWILYCWGTREACNLALQTINHTFWLFEPVSKMTKITRKQLTSFYINFSGNISLPYSCHIIVLDYWCQKHINKLETMWQWLHGQVILVLVLPFTSCEAFYNLFNRIQLLDKIKIIQRGQSSST